MEKYKERELTLNAEKKKPFNKQTAAKFGFRNRRRNSIQCRNVSSWCKDNKHEVDIIKRNRKSKTAISVLNVPNEIG